MNHSFRIRQEHNIDEYDYTLCTQCHSSVQPYCNTSITTITSIITSSSSSSQKCKQIEISITNLKKAHHSTAPLLSYEHMNCQKCGLFIKIHPQFDELPCSKIFICSNRSVPHKYCLCYHCGLLYGVNPNQTTVDVAEIFQSQLARNGVLRICVLITVLRANYYKNNITNTQKKKKKKMRQKMKKKHQQNEK